MPQLSELLFEIHPCLLARGKLLRARNELKDKLWKFLGFPLTGEI